MSFMPRREAVLGFLLLSTCVVLIALPASAGDLIRRDLAAGHLDARRAVDPSRVTDGVLAREIVRVDAALLAAEPETLWLELAPGVWRLAFRSGVEHTPIGGLVWRGRFADDDPERATVILTAYEDLVHGSFLDGRLAYSLRPAGGGAGELVTIAGSRGGDCGGALHAGEDAPTGDAEASISPGGWAAESSGPVAAPGRSTAAATDGRTLSILVVYTSNLEQVWGPHRYAVANAHHAVDWLNTAFQNSRIRGKAFLSGVAPWEPPGTVRDLYGLLDAARVDASLHALRDEARADLVAVVNGLELQPGPCGLGYLLSQSRQGALMDPYAYSVVSHRCEGYNHYTFIHEVGHNMGAQHDPGNGTAPPDQAFRPWAFAHYEGSFNSLMASGGSQDLIFSNPGIEVRGDRAGVEDQRDNARVLDETMPMVAAFRSGGSGVPRVNVPPPVPPPPTIGVSQPTEVRVMALSATEVELRWHDNTTGELGLRIEGRRATGSDDWEIVIDLPIDTERHVVDGLEPATAYRFRVSSVGPNNTAVSDEVRVTTLDAPPAAPAGLAAEPLGMDALRLHWGAVERAADYEVEVRTADPAADRAPESIFLGTDGAVLGGLATATPYTVRVRAVNEVGASAWSEAASATTLGAGGPCAAGVDTLCLLDGRFEVRAQWRNPRAPFGHGVAAAKPAPGSERTGVFTFFDPDNVELVVKMLDGRAVNGAFWHFYGALSDVEYWVSVRDTAAGGGGSRTYHSEPLQICGRGDTTAFAEGPESPAFGALSAGSPAAVASSSGRAVGAAEGACVPGEEALCLAGGRFRVEVEWENPRPPGNSGAGRVFAGLDGDQSGHFWFFRPDNLELSVKILDGRTLNGHFWIFWGGLSDVGYTIHVTDTETAETYDFVNPPLTLCGGAVTDVL